MISDAYRAGIIFGVCSIRAASRQPVAYAELPAAQHNFDFFHSLRFHSVIDAVADFARLTVALEAASHHAQPVDGQRLA